MEGYKLRGCLLLHIAIFLVTTSSSQIPKLLRVVDNVTLSPLSYAHMAIEGSPRGGVSDENGTIDLRALALKRSDHLIFQNIGYQSIEILAEQLLDTVRLSRTDYQLPEATVLSQYKLLKIGGTQPRKRTFNELHENLKGTEIGVRIKDIQQTGIIENINFYLRKNNCDSIRFRMRIYELEKDEQPSRLIHNDDIIRTINSEKKWVTIPLTEYKIILQHKNIAITLETLEIWKSNNKTPAFQFTYDKKVNGFGCARHFSQPDGWGGYSYKGKGFSFNLEIRTF